MSAANEPILVPLSRFTGYTSTRAWLEYADGKLIGMASSTRYDRDDKIVSRTEGLTGCSLVYE